MESTFLEDKRVRKRDYERRYSRVRYWNNLEKMRSDARERQISYRLRYPLQARVSCRNYRLKCKVKALEMVGRGKVECVGCHINDVRVLSINHIKGDGRILRGRRGGGGGTETYIMIIDGRQPIDDLNLLCWNCNHLHWLEMLEKSRLT